MKISPIVGLSAMLVLCSCSAQDEDSQKGTAKTISTPATNEAVTASSATARKEEGKVKEHKSGTWTPGLSDEENETLFAIAKDTLDWCVNGGKGEFSFDKYKITPKLKVPTHTFVTLKIGGNLRGCIGSLPPMAAAPLYESVYDNAVNAALKDWRFSPVRPAELSKLEIDISLLSPVTDIKSLDEFKLGEHGIIILKGGHRAVYLPEVAPEQGWTKEETLASLSEKAGMNPDAWKEGAKFQIYSSVVLSK
jgi:AmmeMemoRadiSam system protein A